MPVAAHFLRSASRSVHVSIANEQGRVFAFPEPFHISDSTIEFFESAERGGEVVGNPNEWESS